LIKREENNLNILLFVSLPPGLAKLIVGSSLVPNIIADLKIVIELSAAFTPGASVNKQDILVTSEIVTMAWCHLMGFARCFFFFLENVSQIFVFYNLIFD